MTRVAGTECATAPLVPVIVSVYVPVGAFFLTEIASVELPALTIDAGLNLPVTALGNPVTASVTVPVKPAPMVTVVDPLLPRAMVMLAGDTDIEKSASTTRVTVTVWLIVPVVPVTASG